MKLTFARNSLFGVREHKSAPSLMVALSQLGAARWGGRDPSALMRDGYLRNAVAYRCVRMIAESAASIPLRASSEELQTRIDRPNPDESGTEFFERLFADLQLTGNAYAEQIMLDGEETPRALFGLRSQRMRALKDAQGWTETWEYRTDHRARKIPREDVLHLKLFHPEDDIYGLSPLAAARTALDLHNASADWAKALLDNAARPSGALIYGKDGARMSDDQFDRLKAELSSAHTGPGNAGRPLLLEGGLDWKPMSLSPAEMDFLEARAGAAREIALAFGVPPMLLGIPGDNTYANYREANTALWRTTILPLAQKTANALTAWLGGSYNGAKVTCDLENVPALAADREALWKRVGDADFLSAEEKRSMLGLPA